MRAEKRQNDRTYEENSRELGETAKIVRLANNTIYTQCVYERDDHMRWWERQWFKFICICSCTIVFFRLLSNGFRTHWNERANTIRTILKSTAQSSNKQFLMSHSKYTFFFLQVTMNDRFHNYVATVVNLRQKIKWAFRQFLHYKSQGNGAIQTQMIYLVRILFLGLCFPLCVEPLKMCEINMYFYDFIHLFFLSTMHLSYGVCGHKMYLFINCHFRLNKTNEINIRSKLLINISLFAAALFIKPK